ncbi:MAG: radical SAM protein [Candidatus Thermoplasmatota archaeon]|nr:radical SAM protein [Candidatus Thermoplasmatota archaeon]
MDTIIILDGYIDEPTCLGVPPFMSTYPRYIAGAIWKKLPNTTIFYYTIDQVRKQPDLISKRFADATLIIVIAGMMVPGKYLSGYPIHPNELKKILKPLSKPKKILCGSAATYGFGISGGKKTEIIPDNNEILDASITGDPEIVISKIIDQNFDFTRVDLSEKRKSAEDIKDFAIKGAKIVNQHPYFPHQLIIEIETYRGCPRYITGGCSFCLEPKKGIPDFRSINSITNEIKALYNQGIRSFRIGNQPCLFSYQAKHIGKKEFPQPNPDALEDLFSTIRTVAPNLDTLHIDNVNPGIIARYPEESEKIAKTIISYHTSGDVAAFGVESIDPKVIKENNLKANENELLSAIRLFNKIGRKQGSNGLPELLPGLNFISGLKGETKKTFEYNIKFLQNIVKNDLLIRRINIRQVIPLPNTIMEETGNTLVKKHKRYFSHFKYQVKHSIDQPLLQKLIPKGTTLTDVFFELWKGKTTFGRQIGSYPLLVGIPGNFPIGSKKDITITDHGYRSVTGIPKPVHINKSQRETIQAIPGIGKKRTIRILANRPFANKQQFIKTFDDVTVAESILKYLSFDQ